MSNFLDQTGLSYFWGKIKSKFLRGNTGGVFYGTCSTAAGTVAKVVECADFTADNLKAGTIIIVTFTATNSGAVANLTMNVNGTGAKHIKCINNGTLENLSSAGYLKANTKYPFYYDGAYWVCWFNDGSEKQDKLTFDSEPTKDSTNPVTSAGIKAYVDKSPLADKKILIIGDSISTDAYGSYKKWVTDLVDDGVFTKSNVTNNSYHATGFVRTYDENSNVVYDNFPNRLKAITDTSYDMVITFGGINDYIGGIEWDAFKTAVDAYFSDLTSRFIDSRLVVISPLRTYNIYKNAAGHYQQEYADYIIKVARSYALPVLDLTHGSGYYPFVDTFKAKWTLVPSGYTGGDGVHPNLEYGKKYLAPLIQNFLENPLSGTYTEPANNVDMSAYYTKAEVDAAIAKAIKEATGTKEFAFDGASRTPKTLVWGDSLSPQYYYTNFNANTGGLGYEITDAKITDTEVTFSNKTYYGGPMFVFKCTAGKTYTLSVDVPFGILSWGELTTTTTSTDTTLPIKAGKPTVLINNWSDSGGHKTFEMKPTTDYFFIAFGKSDKAPITWDNITLTES